MAALFAEGRHPNADQITEDLSGVGLGQAAATPRRNSVAPSGSAKETANTCAGAAPPNTTRPSAWRQPDRPERAGIRTAVGRSMFTEAYGRAPTTAN